MPHGLPLRTREVLSYWGGKLPVAAVGWARARIGLGHTALSRPSSSRMSLFRAGPVANDARRERACSEQGLRRTMPVTNGSVPGGPGSSRADPALFVGAQVRPGGGQPPPRARAPLALNSVCPVRWRACCPGGLPRLGRPASGLGRAGVPPGRAPPRLRQAAVRGVRDAVPMGEAASRGVQAAVHGARGTLSRRPGRIPARPGRGFARWGRPFRSVKVTSRFSAGAAAPRPPGAVRSPRSPPGRPSPPPGGRSG